MRISTDGAPPLLREGLPPVPARIGKREKVDLREARTQKPAILQGEHSFVAQFDWTLASFSGCPFGCNYCYVPDVQWGLPARLGGWGNYLHTRSGGPDWLQQHIKEVEGCSIFMSATTDPYNAFEKEARLTRRMLELLADSGMGFLLVSTRGTLITRDLDLLTGERLRGRVEVGISVPSNLDAVHAALEPYTPAFAKRFHEVALRLKEAGVPVRIHGAPLALHSQGFYELVAACADWLWIDEAQHDADESPELAPWFYTPDEVRQLTEAARALPSLGPARVGFGPDQFGWRWDAGQRCIVAPPPRVKLPLSKRQKGKAHA